VRKEAKFTKHEMEAAIRVLMQSRIVTNWVKSQAEFLGVDLSTPAGQEFYERNARAYAETLIK
jgi:hypothetical protein